MEMTFGELTQGRIDVVAFVLSLFSVFFTIVSAYIAALYFFLGASGLGLRLLAFFVLTVSFLFLGGLAFTVSDLIEVIIAAWNQADIPITSEQRLARHAVRQWQQLLFLLCRRIARLGLSRLSFIWRSPT